MTPNVGGKGTSFPAALQSAKEIKLEDGGSLIRIRTFDVTSPQG
ncbi:MAG: hypothetical protein WBD99_02105 [Thermodesulfobacteriota bacterium]